MNAQQIAAQQFAVQHLNVNKATDGMAGVQFGEEITTESDKIIPFVDVDDEAIEELDFVNFCNMQSCQTLKKLTLMIY